MAGRIIKRRSKLPNPRLQFRILGPLVGMFVLVLLLQALVLAAELTTFANQLPSDGPEVLEQTPGLLLRCVLISLCVLLPVVLLVGVHVTFRIAGPLYRFERHLTSIAEGEWPKPCRIRNGDRLQNFCRLLNEALEGAREQGAAEAMTQEGRQRTRATRGPRATRTAG